MKYFILMIGFSPTAIQHGDKEENEVCVCIVAHHIFTGIYTRAQVARNRRVIQDGVTVYRDILCNFIFLLIPL